MAEVGGMLAAAVLKMVGAQIGSVLQGRIPLHQHFGEDLEDMKTTLETVSALLQDAEKRSMKDATVLLWLKRLKGVMYDIYNMLDEFEVDTEPSSTKCTIMIPCLTIGPKMKTANKMKTINKNLENITKQHNDFGFKSEDISNVQQVLCTDRQTSPKVEEASIVGRDQEKLKILNSLSNKSMTQDFNILPIYGIGGIGKTTLAQLVFKDKEFKDYSRVWVYVSQIFDLNKIENSIISQLPRSEPTITDLEMIPANRKILIVLDDLWENDGFKLDRLKLMLNFGKEAKVVVIVTTRNEDLARRFCTVEPYKIEPLLDDMCWKIIKQKSAFDNRDDKEPLENIGREIAMKCGGVALAAQCLGYLLHSKRLEVWQSVKDSDIWNESTSEDTYSLDHVLASLKLTYISMIPCLKLCFGYCAIFPKGHKIIKDDLIHQWISLGFIQPSNISSPKQLGETYVTNLLGMSFLQHHKSPLPNGQHDEDVTFFTMHDLVHDLARSVMGDEIFDSSRKCHNGESNCQYALLTDCSIRLELCVTSPHKVRALRFLHCGKSVLINDAAFSTAKYLRVLDLKECSIHHLPASIGQLKLLRYLSAPGVQDATIPKSITKLSKLSYLNLSGSSAILALPDSIGEMGSLLYLDLSYCSRIEQLPESFSKLKNLVHLDLSNCSNVTRLSESLGKLTQLNYLNLAHCKNIGHSENSFGSLTQLQYSNLSCSSYIKVPSLDTILGSFTKLKYLNLSSEQKRTVRFPHDNIEPEYLNSLPEGFGNCIELEYLNLSGCEYLEALPQSFGELINLVHLDLSGCVRVKGVLEALHTLTKLRYLNLSDCFHDSEAQRHPDGLSQVLQKLVQLRYLNLSKCIDIITNSMTNLSVLASISTLSSLEHLDLSYNMYAIGSLPESFCTLTRLHTLDLSWCSHLFDIPDCIADMDNLKFVHVNGCDALDKSRLIRVNKSLVMLPNFVVQAGEGEASSNLVLLKDVNPRHLEISSLEIVKSVEEARRIKLREKQSMVDLKLEWTRETKGLVEDMELLGELVPPSSLGVFILKGYNGVSFPAWLMGLHPNNLCNIVIVELVGLSQCSRLPPLGQLPSLEEVFLKEIPMVTNIDGGFCGGVEAFSKLIMFSISDMDNLEEWTTTYSYGKDVVDESFMFPNLVVLQISNCHKLRLNPCPPRVAEYMYITDSDGVLSPNWGERVRLPHSTTSSALVFNLEVISCKAPMHQWRLLHHLPALNKLTISECSDMPISSSPEINPDFFSFHELDLFCNDSAELPKWLGGLTSLKNLVIRRCRALKGWKDFIRRCTSLESLQLIDCQAMTSLPQWLGNLTSLRELGILYCHELDNLEGSIRHLSSLESDIEALWKHSGTAGMVW